MPLDCESCQSHIDALDSKHRDLKMDVSLLCSNAGFTADAIRKAKRLGIGLVGVVREDDHRIRYRIFDEIYVRRIDVVSTNINFEFKNPVPPQGGTRVEEIVYDGVPVRNWLVHRVHIFLGWNPIVKGVHSLRFRFKTPIEFTLPSGRALAVGVRIQFEITGGWFAQTVEIDATSGLYDWIRQTIRLGPGVTRTVYKGVKIGKGGTPIDCPPDFNSVNPTSLSEGEVMMWVVDVGGLDLPKDIPSIGQFVMDEDLAPAHHNLPRESYYS